MNRRTFVAVGCTAVTASLGGCMNNVTEPNGATSEPDDTSEEGTRGTGTTREESDGTTSGESAGMTLSLAGVDDDLERLSFEVEVVDDRLTESDVPTLDVAVENTSEKSVAWEQKDSESAFPAREVTPDRLAIGVEDAITGRLLEEPGCARVGQRIGGDDVVVATELAPGETIEQRYAVVGKDQKLNGACPPADTYRTEWHYRNQVQESDYGTWGFEFDLEG